MNGAVTTHPKTKESKRSAYSESSRNAPDAASHYPKLSKFGSVFSLLLRDGDEVSRSSF